MVGDRSDDHSNKFWDVIRSAPSVVEDKKLVPKNWGPIIDASSASNLASILEVQELKYEIYIEFSHILVICDENFIKYLTN